MLLPPSRFLLLSFRFSSSARWLSRCRAAVAVAELFAAAAAGDTVEVLLSSSFMLPSVAGAGRCNVVVFFLFLPQVIRLARCRHGVLGGARMVDVSVTPPSFNVVLTTSD